MCKQLIIYYQNVRWKPVPVFDQIKRRYLRFLWWLVRNGWLQWGGYRILSPSPISSDLFAKDFIVGVIRWFNKFCRFKNLISLQSLFIFWYWFLSRAEWLIFFSLPLHESNGCWLPYYAKWSWRYLFFSFVHCFGVW